MSTKSFFHSLTILSFLLISSCSTPPQNISEMFTNSPVLLKAEKMNFQTQYVHEPREFIVLDSLIILNDSQKDMNFGVFNRTSGKLLFRFGKIGRGPNELISCSQLRYNRAKKRIEFMTHSPSRCYSVKVDSILENKTILNLQFTTPLSLTFSQLLDAQREHYILWAYGDSARFGILDNTGKPIEYLSDWAGVAKEMRVTTSDLSNAIQCAIITHPDSALAIVASENHPERVLLEYSGKLRKKKVLFGDKLPIVLSYGSNSIASNDKGTWGYVDISVSANHIYELYSNGSWVKDKTKVMYTDEVLVYDWNLNPIVKYKLPYKTNHIVVSDDGKYLYSFVAIDNKLELVRYAIPK